MTSESTAGKTAIESTLIRNNLMTREGYSPYCGAPDCTEGMPRAAWDKNKGQFTCKCGWISDFAADFITRYRNKFNK